MKTTLATLLALVALAASAADSQRLIPFQGRLTDQSGTPYTEGLYTVVFSLYDAPVGGRALWTERHASVGLVNGMVNVFLGSITDLSGQDFTKTRYLGITIDADGNANTPDPEMIPRQMIIPAFFAKDSEKLMGADWSAILANGSTDPRTGYIAGARIAEKTITTDKLADDAVTTAKIKDANVTADKIADDSITPSHLSAAAMNDLASKFLPPGVIMPFAGANIPDGWLLCDGHAYPSTQYPALFAAIGTIWGSETNITENGVTYFKVPNFQNRTLWGADQKVLGTYVAAGLPNITGDLSLSRAFFNGSTGAFTVDTQTTGAETDAHSFITYNKAHLNASRSSPIYGNSDTVQPPAAAVNFIIKCDPTF